MSKLIVNDPHMVTVIKEHIKNNNLHPLILISEIIDPQPENIDVFTIGTYPSKELLNILAEVLQKLIQEREDYLAGRETT